MATYLKAMLLLALVLCAAYTGSILFAPDVVPLADTREPQAHLQLAFVLRTIELTCLGGLALLLIAAVPAYRANRLRAEIKQ